MRRITIISGIVAALFGLLIILSATIAPYWRLLASAIWLVFSARELLGIVTGHKLIRRIHIDSDGSVELVTNEGEQLPAKLLAGSIVLPTLAWLRLEAHDGRRSSELIHGKNAQDKQWRHLQVIWRHLGAGG
jgi:hypothetical protein